MVLTDLCNLFQELRGKQMIDVWILMRTFFILKAERYTGLNRDIENSKTAA